MGELGNISGRDFVTAFERAGWTIRETLRREVSGTTVDRELIQRTKPMNRRRILTGLLLGFLMGTQSLSAAVPRKAHVVALGAAHKVAYSRTGDPAGAQPGETELKIRALLIDGVVKEWTTGEAHDVTDRSFVVRRVLRINDVLPTDKPEVKSAEKPAAPVLLSAWVWQRGPWLLVDRVTGHIVALKLPDYDPGVSQLAWFRDYGAYCGVTASGKSLYAVVAQVAGRKPLLAKKLSAFDPENHPQPVCELPVWQREPLRVTFHPAGGEAIGYDLAPGSAVLVEDSEEEPK